MAAQSAAILFFELFYQFPIAVMRQKTKQQCRSDEEQYGTEV